MSAKKVIVIGCGNRGKTYTDIMSNEFAGEFEVVAVAEPIEDRREYMRKKHCIPAEMCFESWEPLLEMEKFADVALIATMDRDHYAPAMAAIEKGYDLMLEKPMSPSPEECRAIQHAAEQKGVFVLVCHVLRFTKFFKALKNMIDDGEVGRVMAIQHLEGVGDVHHSHSFVRGNWGNSDRSSCMILQKSCHDMDILAWMIGKKCTSVQSYGTLSYFRRENAPEGSPERCIDGCPVADTCPYNAVKLYVEEPNKWFGPAATKKIHPTQEDYERSARETQFGKCVFKCDNNVVDHQVVNLRFGDDVLVDFCMSAFTRGGRVLRIMGTKGEINAVMDGNKIEIYDFITRERRTVDVDSKSGNETIMGGHGGGDSGIVLALLDLLNGKKSKSICEIKESCDSHMIAFAAEKARVEGTIIDMRSFDSEY
ncbi:MAG: Gfo/Idh/MocA family oxidoreductase [Ruminococcaceae bacterium]|nr:Gfo/Idh/MocA family oxidoreductase [Oscillospiraceae bacterium]